MSSRLFSALLFFACLPIAAQQAPTAPPAQAPSAASKRIPIPETFTNLTVLPANIARPDLMTIMRQFSISMKVRCSACHAVNDDLTEGNFASDEKPMKADTRKLMLLIQKFATPLKP